MQYIHILEYNSVTNKELSADSCYSVDERTKGYIVYDYICMKYSEYANP